MAIVLHKFIPDAELHNPKDFINGNPMSYAIKNANNLAKYYDIESLPGAINFVDGNAAPPTTNANDIYVIFDGGGGVVNAGWGAASFNDWVQYNSTSWDAVSPGVGFMCYDKTANELKKFDGVSWSVIGGGGGGGNTIYTADDQLTGVRSVDQNGNDLSFIGNGGKFGVNAEMIIGAGLSGLTVLGGGGAFELRRTGTVGAFDFALNHNAVGQTQLSYAAGQILQVLQDTGQETARFSGTDFGVGITTALGARVHIQGEGATSATSSIISQNSLAEKTFEVDNGGQTFVYGLNFSSSTDVFTVANPLQTLFVLDNAGGFALGENATYGDDTNVSIGKNANATGLESIAIGRGATTGTTVNSTAIGLLAQITSGNRSVAIGDTANASGGGSAVAIGFQSVSSSIRSIAIGATSSSSDEGAIAIGDGAIASRFKSISIGDNAQVTTQNYGISIGLDTLTTGFAGLAIGRNMQSGASYAYMIGGSTTTKTNATTNSFEVNFNEVTSTIRLARNADSWINTANNFGIGIATPGAKLHVNGTVRVDGQTATGATAGADTLPSNPVGFITINLDGTNYKVPYYNV